METHCIHFYLTSSPSGGNSLRHSPALLPGSATWGSGSGEQNERGVVLRLKGQSEESMTISHHPPPSSHGRTAAGPSTRDTDPSARTPNPASGGGQKLQVVRAEGAKAPRPRVQVDIPDATHEAMARIIATSGLKSQGHVVRVAIHLLDEMLKEKNSGASILLVTENEPPRKMVLAF
jgi:hypothetical protein